MASANFVGYPIRQGRRPYHMYWAVVGGPLHIRTLLLKKTYKMPLALYTIETSMFFLFVFFNTAVFGPEDHCGRSTGCCKSRHLSSVTHYCGKYIYEDIITIFFGKWWERRVFSGFFAHHPARAPTCCCCLLACSQPVSQLNQYTSGLCINKTYSLP